MKKLFFTACTMFLGFSSFSQWTYETIKNDFDEPYRIAYTSQNNGAILKLEELEGDIIFYIQGGYYCDDYPSVDLVFDVNGENVKFLIEGMKNKKGDVVFFTGDVATDIFLEPFQKCTTLKIRINESYCSTETYTFNMSRSSSALNFMQNK